jgi:hypothetical protein
VLQFHRAFPVSEIVSIGADATADAMLVHLQSRQVSGAWLLEYCGVAFADNTHDDLPLSPAEANALFAASYRSYRKFEEVRAATKMAGRGARKTLARNAGTRRGLVQRLDRL